MTGFVSPDLAKGVPLDEDIFPHGIDGTTGRPVEPSLTLRELAQAVTSGTRASDWWEELRLLELRRSRTYLDVVDRIDPRRLDEAGWGVVLPRGAPRTRLEALAPLIEHRRRSGGPVSIFAGDAGLGFAETKTDFLSRYGVGPGLVDPRSGMPYYLLLVGDPGEISYDFQRQLGISYAVGRIAFPRVDDYNAYALKVVDMEKRSTVDPPRATFFGPRHDWSTAQSSTILIASLAEAVSASNPGWITESIVGKRATKATLGELVNGPRSPSFLMTASHGLIFPEQDERYPEATGALLCSDWQPSGEGSAIDETCYFSASDCRPTSQGSMISFHFACYSGGATTEDSFPHRPARLQPPRPWLARLPQALLAAPQGGALATIVHLDRAWSTSFRWPSAGPQWSLFEQVVQRILSGHRIGHALGGVSVAYTETLADLHNSLESSSNSLNPHDISLLWTAAADFGNFLLFGDPAVSAPIAPSIERRVR